MKKTIPYLLLFVMILGSVFSDRPVYAAQCALDHVWVEGYHTQGGAWIPGFCRPIKKTGYKWIEGRSGPDGRWIPGYWKPIGLASKNRVWVPGRVNEHGVRAPGHWRQKYDDPKKIWVPGHYNPKGQWIPGHWR